MKDKQYVFAGNRFFVLGKMLEEQLPITKIFAPPSSFLERELVGRGIAFEPMGDKKQLVDALRGTDFDYFISNGCPYILPITELRSGTNKHFVNIHPSLLPDLRGADPVPGALLYGRPSGATAHHMNDGIDAGDIIAQVPIEMSDDLDCGLLYQLSFIAEQEVFLKAYRKGFRPQAKQTVEQHHLYYTLKEDQLRLDFSEDLYAIVRRIKAFSTRSRGAFFSFGENTVKVRDAEVVSNPFLLERFADYKDNQVVFNYENRLLLKKGNRFLKLKQLEGDIAAIQPGDVLR